MVRFFICKDAINVIFLHVKNLINKYKAIYAVLFFILLYFYMNMLFDESCELAEKESNFLEIAKKKNFYINC